ncbi:MAG: cbb3-type cytochrome oxidase assembly protein CcoS [Gammaproteobacteria bacterium]|jgi:cbb3-type cytochrome oxidase maturation protein|nr:cbb3-type cytochrome oxidase assembly protein CcoS [Gammaproteobacteria bacterium]MCP4882012.1 cbb3-type cytochrome oxidase assembly protein CcoS [Gammaproteobacteria bacterium]MDP6167007.1 cbb3-type cytochrome oxidase assembly protein CcoS [Gammaproteobacteria bacterium]
MEIIFLLIPVAIILVAVAVYALHWSLKNGQFDDMDSPASKILFDDDDDLIPDDAKPKSKS